MKTTTHRPPTGPTPTRFEEGRIGPTLRRWIAKHPGVVRAISHGGGYCTDRGTAYDVLLAPGYIVPYEGHIIIEATVEATIGQLSRVTPCDCADCQAEIKAGY